MKSMRRNPSFNTAPGSIAPPTRVKLDDLESRSIAERIEQFIDRTFVADYRLPARSIVPEWRTYHAVATAHPAAPVLRSVAYKPEDVTT